MPQPIGSFLFCIEFGWGWGCTKLISVLCMNLLVEVEKGGILNLVEFSLELVQNLILNLDFFVVGWLVRVWLCRS